MQITDTIRKLQTELGSSCRLIAVSKTQPDEKILEAYDAGQRLFGENKVQDLTAKAERLPKDIEWHMIGHLQRNKVKYIAPFVHLIHSVDSLRLLEEIDKQAAKNGRILLCLLQVHIAAEETKFGFDRQEMTDAWPVIGGLKHVRIIGLMGMATLTEDTDRIRSEFHGLKRLFDELKQSPPAPNVEMMELSMGMSSDYRIAVEEGSTLVRIGTTIFGARNYPVTA